MIDGNYQLTVFKSRYDGDSFIVLITYYIGYASAIEAKFTGSDTDWELASHATLVPWYPIAFGKSIESGLITLEEKLSKVVTIDGNNITYSHEYDYAINQLEQYIAKEKPFDYKKLQTVPEAVAFFSVQE